MWESMRRIALAVLGMTMLLVPGHAQAVIIVGTYSVDANNVDPGLVIQTHDLAPSPFTWDLSAGETISFDLLDIWTNEKQVNWDDEVAHPVTVSFAFTAPPPPFGGAVEGETEGASMLYGILQWGSVTWNGPLNLNFGVNGDGALSISLSNEWFNFGFFGLTEGEGYGATVVADVTLISEPDTYVVPQPATLSLMGMGLLGLGLLAAWQRRPQSPARPHRSATSRRPQ